MASDNTSIKSASSKTKTPTEGGKRVGFARPSLIIPPPQANAHRAQYSANLLYTPGTAGTAGVALPPEMYGRKASMFVFNQLHDIRDFTMSTAKSGLGMGEKSAYWMYKKTEIVEQKMVHAFLPDSRDDDVLTVRDIRQDKYDYILSLSNISLDASPNKSIEIWNERAREGLYTFKGYVIEYHQTQSLIDTNGAHKMWTIMNAIVYCATVYTSIVIMDSVQTTTENQSEQNSTEKNDNGVDISRIEAMLTPEQVFSDNIARKRRRFTKKRSTSLTRREATPVRNLDDKVTTTSDEDIVERKPRTPDRPRRPRRTKSAGKRDFSETEYETGKPKRKENVLPLPAPNTNGNDSTNNTDQDVKDHRKKSLSNLAQTEVVAFLHKTKKSITAAAIRGRDRFRKDKELVKRSRSAPHQFTEEELIESFRRAQLLSKEDVKPRKFSESSIQSLTPEVPFEPKPFRPEVQEFVRKRKKQKEYSTKIIEVLDPKTSAVISRKAIIRPDFKLRELFWNLRMFSIFEIFKYYKAYKIYQKRDYQIIRKQWNRCMCELFIIMVYCGIGGIMFKFMEGSFENYYKCGVKRVKRDFIDLLWVKSHNLREDDWKSLARNRLRIFEEELHNAHEAGMTSYSGQRSWSFLNAVVYSLTVVTSIGYGHLVPKTTTGQSVTIVYALIGIPLFLIVLTDFGKLFTRCIKFLWSFVRRLYYTGSCRRYRKTAHMQQLSEDPRHMTLRPWKGKYLQHFPKNPTTPIGSMGASVDTDTPTTPALSNFEIDDEFNLPITVALFILISYTVVGASFYSMVEGMNFFTSFYFVFISMSTIGFGDIVPKNRFCMILSIVYLVFGLALMSMCINVVQEKLSDTFKKASAKLGATIGFQMEEDGSVVTMPPETVEIPGVHDPAVIDADGIKPTINNVNETKKES
ncbi:hypothetical protein NQ317_013858 [Molorchus minor]|uniref:Potassium channel domain-containing protein n=1 Tax=Molorchus minor TaxID=1323400 RepID=A0ABQ9K5U6_9CUCU|nr:hypothetical protein NQ317_013858 [Molorchus minor]